MDLFAKLKHDETPLGRFALSEEYFTFPKLEGELSSRMKFKGRDMIIWSLNNYLGLANHPEIRKADADAAAKYGLAYPMGARIMSGNTDAHVELERGLAKFVGKEAGQLLNFGYQGMLSTIDAILSRHDVVVYDSEAHACILDGLRMHIGKRFVYQHNDMASLRSMLEKATKVVDGTPGGILVITEGVFGMSGDMGKLAEIVELKKDFEFRFLVDDAHGFGMMGKTGAGTHEHQNCIDGVDIYFSTFAKAMASIGAFIAGEERIINYIKYNSRSQIFAKSLPMPLVVGGLKRLEMLKNVPEMRKKLWDNVNMLQNGLRERGFNLGRTNTAITPVYLQGTLQECANIIFDIRETYGIFTSPVMYPVIPKGLLMLRLIPTAVHTERDIRETIDAFTAIGNKLQTGEYKNIKLIDLQLEEGVTA